MRRSEPDLGRKSAHVTSRDVARLAGVSQTAVSLVMNGGAERQGLSPATQERVRAAATALGYTPNHLARSLRRQRTSTITFIVADLGNRYTADVVSAADTLARAHGYIVQVIEARDPEAERLAFDRVASGSTDGLVVHGGTPETRRSVERLRARGIACVLLQDPDEDPSVPCVRADITGGGAIATRHLLALGHRHIAHITDRALEGAGTNERLEGYRRALSDAGVGFDPHRVIAGDNSFAGGHAAMQVLIQRAGPRPTAVFVFNDQMAVGGLSALRVLGLRAPEDVAVIGFDGTELGAFSTPSLTTIEHPRHELGRRAAEILLAELEGTPAPARETLPVRLIIRQSCGEARKGQ